jgi:hypothetical protein
MLWKMVRGLQSAGRRYLEFVRSIRDTRAKAVEELVAFLASDEFLQILGSNEADA